MKRIVVHHYIKEYTMSQNQPSSKLLRFFAKMPKNLQEEVIESMIQKYHLFKSKEEKQNRSALYLRSLLVVLEEYDTKLKIGSSKKHSRELETLGDKSSLRVKMLTYNNERLAKKRSKLIGQYAPMIYRFKELEHKSFSWIQAYLSKFHKMKVDHTYLCKLYPVIVKKITMEKDNGATH